MLIATEGTGINDNASSGKGQGVANNQNRQERKKRFVIWILRTSALRVPLHRLWIR